MGLSTFLVTLLQLCLLPVIAVVGVLCLLATSLMDCASVLPRLTSRPAHAPPRLPVVLGSGKKLKPPRSIVVTGASTGFGEALALHYAKPGVTLALTGRNEARLKAVVKACTALCVQPR